jgi:dienelactone hydrolase
VHEPPRLGRELSSSKEGKSDRLPSEDTMKKTVLALLLPALLGAIAPAFAEIRTKEVSYSGGDATMKGFLAWDDAKEGPRPGILVVHEWWGHNDYVRRRARMLAELGYTALAVDMYGDGKQALHPDDAGKFASETMKNLGVAKARFEAARKLLVAEPTVDPKRIGAIGYCFGGGVVLEMARRGVDLSAVVVFHGSLATREPAKKGQVKARLLVLNGGADSLVTPEEIAAIAKEMKDAGADYRLVSYPGAKHAYTNPAADDYAKKFKLPIAYDAAADRESWEEMKRFLEKSFAGGGGAPKK